MANPRVQLDMPLILARIAAGEYVAHIAKQVGLSKQRLRNRVLANPQGLQAIEQGKVSRASALRNSFAESVLHSLKALDRGRTIQADVLARAYRKTGSGTDIAQRGDVATH